MTWVEYAQWIDANGGLVKFTAEIDKLEEWPMLPKQEYAHGCKLFCRICKCWLPAKSYVGEKQCPLGKWDSSLTTK